MATLGVKAFELTEFGESDAGHIFLAPEAASQTFAVGDPLVGDTAGRVKLGVDTGNFFAMAWSAANGVTDHNVYILVVNENMIFSVSYSDAGVAGPTIRADVFGQYSYIKSTETGETAKTVLDQDDTTNKNWEVLDLDSRDALGDTNGRLLVRAVRGKLVAR